MRPEDIAADEALAREREADDANKMNVPCFGLVYKRQMAVNFISFLLAVMYFCVIWFTGRDITGH